MADWTVAKTVLEMALSLYQVKSHAHVVDESIPQ